MAVARDDASGEDKVTVQGASFETVLHFDAEGRVIASEGEDVPFAARTSSWDFDLAASCCWTGSPTNHCVVSKGICSTPGVDRCFSPWFTAANEFGNGYMMCDTSGFY